MEILRKLVNVAENDPRIGCVGPKIKDLDGNIVAPYIKRPTWWDLSIGIKNARNERAKHRFDREWSTECMVVACCLEIL